MKRFIILPFHHLKTISDQNESSKLIQTFPRNKYIFMTGFKIHPRDWNEMVSIVRKAERIEKDWNVMMKNEESRQKEDICKYFSFPLIIS